MKFTPHRKILLHTNVDTTIFLVSILCLMLFLRSNGERSLKAFRYFLIIIVLWLISNYALKIFNNEAVVLFSLKTTFATSALMLLSLYRFSNQFPNEILSKYRAQNWIVSLSTILIIALSYTNLLVSGFTVKDSLVLANYGSIFDVYLFYILLMFGMILYFFWNQNKISSPLKKQQSKFLFMGVILSMIFISSIDLVIPILSKSNTSANFGPYGIVFLVAFAFLALTKHHLFETKVIVSEFWATFLVVAIFGWLVIHFSIGNLIGFLFIFSVCILFIRSVISEAEKGDKLEKANKQLERDKKQLIKNDKLKDEFIMMTNHELSTPITAIRGKLSMAVLEDAAPIHLDENEKEYFMPVLTATDRLNHLSRQLIDVTTIDQEKVLIYPGPTVLDDLIKEVIIDFQESANLKNDKLIYAPTQKSKPINLDPKKIKAVLSSLIENGIHFTKDGKITVETKLDESKQNVIVSVADTGAGVDESAKDLFNKFSQSNRFDKNSVEQQGAGLSLYIAKNYIKLHGGKIWFESEKSKGSTFYFSIPITLAIPKAAKEDASFDTSQFTL